MKILLLAVNSQTFYYRQAVIPFGLVSLGSYVMDEGYAIRGIDMNSPPEKIYERYLSTDKRLLGEILEYAPDLVAMSTYAENIFNVLFWAEIIKQKLPKTWIAIGGNHVSYIAREVLEKSNAIDFVVRFEGEIPFKELCKKREYHDTNYDDVANLSYRKNGTIIENELTNLLPDLDLLPQLNLEFFERTGNEEVVHTDIISARGCPFHCTFCNCNHYWGKKYRVLSVERVIHHLKRLKEKYPNLQTVRFRDETLTVQKERTLALCDKIIENQMDLQFQAHSRLDGLDEELIKRLSESGFTQLSIGLESGSQNVLDRLKKGISLKKVYTIVPLLRKYHIKFRFSLMLATPDERLEESLQTIRLIRDLDFDFDEFYFGQGIIIYPGTTDCRNFLQKHPDFQWLSDQELHEGYHKTLDYKGNTVVISYVNPQYTLDELHQELQKELHSKLKKYGEVDYFHLRRMEYISRIRNHRFKSVDEFRATIRMFVKRLDEKGKKWGIMGNLTYYKNIFYDIITSEKFYNFTTFIVFTDRNDETVQRELRKKLKSIEYLLIALVDDETNLCTNYCFEKLRFAGRILLFDTFIVNDVLIKQLKHSNFNAIINDISIKKDFKKILLRKILKQLQCYRLAVSIVKIQKKYWAEFRSSSK